MMKEPHQRGFGVGYCIFTCNKVTTMIWNATATLGWFFHTATETAITVEMHFGPLWMALQVCRF